MNNYKDAILKEKH